jgi:uncharacterized membrane protein (UPF0136 family)
MAVAYNSASDKFVVTGYTDSAGSRGRLSNVKTLDSATALTLLAAAAGSATLTLTKQIRPVENLALIISLVVAAKTAEADYIFITGTDAWDAAQTESIDVSAGNGTYTTTKRWRTITNLDCSDNSAGGGTVWADGTLAVTQPIIGGLYQDGKYFRLDIALDWGDNSTATYFEVIEGEFLYCADGILPMIEASSATVKVYIGQFDGYGPVKSAAISMQCPAADTYQINDANGQLLVYASSVFLRNGSRFLFWRYGTCYFLNSALIGIDNQGRCGFSTSCTWSMVNSVISGMKYFYPTASPLSWQNSSLHLIDNVEWYGTTTTLVGLNATRVVTSRKFVVGGSTTRTAIYRNPLSTIDQSWVQNNTATAIQLVQWSINLKVVTPAGAAISGATVVMKDQTGTAVFTQTTDANGQITEQWVERVRWTTTSETETDSSPHVLTVTAAGFETLTIPAITLSEAIDWTVELQTQIKRPLRDGRRLLTI